jgi:7-carboxy-7-deazaguanine synthase
MTFECDEDLRVVEQFYSIQGESTFAGMPCHFVRLHGCNLRCEYCDTPYAYDKDSKFYPLPVKEFIKFYLESGVKLIEITGGEPLLQLEPVVKVCQALVDRCTILIETNGSIDISAFKMAPQSLVLIMDVKTPSSRMSSKINYENFKHLRPVDEIKFVVGNYEDFEFAKQICEKYSLATRCKPLVSPVFGQISLPDLASWVLNETPYMRMQVQLQKILWSSETRGV